MMLGFVTVVLSVFIGAAVTPATSADFGNGVDGDVMAVSGIAYIAPDEAEATTEEFAEEVWGSDWDVDDYYVDDKVVSEESYEDDDEEVVEIDESELFHEGDEVEDDFFIIYDDFVFEDEEIPFNEDELVIHEDDIFYGDELVFYYDDEDLDLDDDDEIEIIIYLDDESDLDDDDESELDEGKLERVEPVLPTRHV